MLISPESFNCVQVGACATHVSTAAASEAWSLLHVVVQFVGIGTMPDARIPLTMGQVVDTGSVKRRNTRSMLAPDSGMPAAAPQASQWLLFTPCGRNSSPAGVYSR